MAAGLLVTAKACKSLHDSRLLFVLAGGSSCLEWADDKGSCTPLQAALGPDSAEALPRRRRRRKPAALRDDDDEDEEPEEEPLQEDDEDGLNNRSGPT